MRNTILAAALLACAIMLPAHAADNIKIGVVYPLTGNAAAERQGIPFLVADSVALNITQRGFKWTFRVGPIAPDFAKAYTSFLNDLKKAGRKIDLIAVVNENTDYGTSVAASIIGAAKDANIEVAAH